MKELTNSLSELTITRKEISEAYGVTEDSVSVWASKGQFPLPLRGKKYIWSREAVRLHMISSTLPDKDIEKLMAFQKYI
ncbi:hypothetical protein GCM10007161_13050 [Ignatzschineria indica]|uniref:DNA-binding protein n=1 Tax=Ignatzschineria indica TaxID=472583 RepID=A0A2U2AJU0_9GAMM|nr:hypothetical protein [Ignatzschineria indica]PWD83093.1 hypothetical protein DC082_06630 [Ignatzschineria indica]GGZ82988.1 hypothetical protein GCM10007161_13050 [Ignatzschineria indica]